jgi:hypothetical protein
MPLSNKDIREIAEARKARRAIPQIDPPDVIGPPEPERAQTQAPAAPPASADVPELVIGESPPPEEAPPPPENSRTLERESDRDALPLEVAERPLYLTPVDTSEKPSNQGFHMYPSRHKQLRDLAYYEDRNPWEIVDQALGEYVKRHYGSKVRK